jgi:type I restriction enzyme S subunit
MSNQWPVVKLGEVLWHRKEFVTIDDVTSYKRPRVQLHVRGIVQRDEISGALIKTKTQQVCRAGEFLVAEIDAKVGGFGIVPKSLDGSIVSSHYFLFVIDESKLDRCFLDFFIRTPAFREQVAAQGSTNYAAIRPAHVLGYEIPLPPLAEQRRVVARIGELAGQIHEARSLRHQATEEVESLVSARSAEVFRQSSGNETVPLESIAILERGKFSHRPRNEPRFFGGTHPWIQIGEIESAEKFIRRWTETLNDDGLAISKKFPKGTVLISIAATIGAVGILDFDCCIPDSIVGVTPRNGTDSEFLYHFLRYLREHLEEIAPQSAQKNINLQILSRLPVPKLSLLEQRRIVAELDALQAEVDALKRLQAETAAELDALLPSLLDRAFKGEL